MSKPIEVKNLSELSADLQAKFRAIEKDRTLAPGHDDPGRTILVTTDDDLDWRWADPAEWGGEYCRCGDTLYLRWTDDNGVKHKHKVSK